MSLKFCAHGEYKLFAPSSLNFYLFAYILRIHYTTSYYNLLRTLFLYFNKFHLRFSALRRTHIGFKIIRAFLRVCVYACMHLCDESNPTKCIFYIYILVSNLIWYHIFLKFLILMVHKKKIIIVCNVNQ